MKTKILGSALVSLGVILALAAVLPVATLSVLAKVPGANGLIAFVRSDFNTGIDTTYIMNPDGSHLQAVLPGIGGTGAPHWSPDGSKLALQAGLNNPCPPCAASTIIFNPDTGNYRVLSPPDPNLATNCSIWSPDARRFACEVGSNDGSRNGIYTIRTSDGRGLTQITSNAGGDDVPIDYSPDGRQIVFGRVGPNHNCTRTSALYVVNVDGTGLHQITPGGFCDDDGSWSPDGSKIVFAHDGSLFVVHPDGTRLAKIPLATSPLNREGDATWSPDGTKIAFILDTSTQEGIGTANADGSNVQLVTSALPYFDHEADWGPHPLVP